MVVVAEEVGLPATTITLQLEATRSLESAISHNRSNNTTVVGVLLDPRGEGVLHRSPEEALLPRGIEEGGREGAGWYRTCRSRHSPWDGRSSNSNRVAA